MYLDYSLRATFVFVLLMAGLAAAPVPAAAGSFQVNPVNLIMPAGRSTTSLQIKNSDTAPIAVRVLAYRWTQENGRDIYSETGDIIASPPIFSVPPGGTQLIRLGVKNRSASGAYRIILEEIPREQPQGAQIQVALRLDLPLYLLSTAGGKADLSWSTWRDRHGDLFVGATNRGSLHAQVLELSALDTTGARAILSQQMGVILPGSMRQWKIDKRTDFGVGSPMMLKIRNPAGDMQANVVVEQR